MWLQFRNPQPANDNRFVIAAIASHSPDRMRMIVVKNEYQRLREPFEQHKMDQIRKCENIKNLTSRLPSKFFGSSVTRRTNEIFEVKFKQLKKDLNLADSFSLKKTFEDSIWDNCDPVQLTVENFNEYAILGEQLCRFEETCQSLLAVVPKKLRQLYQVLSLRNILKLAVKNNIFKRYCQEVFCHCNGKYLTPNNLRYCLELLKKIEGYEKLTAESTMAKALQLRIDREKHRYTLRMIIALKDAKQLILSDPCAGEIAQYLNPIFKNEELQQVKFDTVQLEKKLYLNLEGLHLNEIVKHVTNKKNRGEVTRIMADFARQLERVIDEGQEADQLLPNPSAPEEDLQQPPSYAQPEPTDLPPPYAPEQTDLPPPYEPSASLSVNNLQFPMHTITPSGGPQGGALVPVVSLGNDPAATSSDSEGLTEEEPKALSLLSLTELLPLPPSEDPSKDPSKAPSQKPSYWSLPEKSASALRRASSFTAVPMERQQGRRRCSY
eukprot:GHVH01014044.1.p1 GENE.GHVH01014044.1~~GHVH01014044.1.p1  ORF type:complete len:494 (+),score=54.75 GHVH01014044.1:73-1554(+)